MFPSASNTNCAANYNSHPFSSSSLTAHDHDHIMPGSGTSFTGDKNCSNGSSLLEEDPAVPNSPPFWHFPPVSFVHDDDDDDDNGLLMSHLLSQPQHQFLGSTTNDVAPPDSGTNAPAPLAPAASRVKDTVSKKGGCSKRKRSGGSNIGGAKQGIPRKRSGKKDRHSKIYTAHGPRDRRMRLSLQIARKFFDLQDMLGFDKASKTIDWLFSKSKAAIKELTDNLPAREVKPSFSTGGGEKSMSSTSESEVLSSTAAATAKEWEMDNNIMYIMGEQQGSVIATSVVEESTRPSSSRGRGKGRDESTITTKQERKLRKAPFSPPVARESRDKARARARERTMEKLKMRSSREVKCSSDHESNPNSESLEHLQSSSSSHPENSGDQNLGPSNHQPNSYLRVVAEEKEEEEEEATPQPQQSTCTNVDSHLLEHQMDSVSIIEKFLGISTLTSTRPTPSPSPMFNYSSLGIAAAGSSRENSEENDVAIFPANWGMINNVDRIQHGYCAMSTNIKEPIGSAQEQNPNPNPSSITMMMDPNIAVQGENPSPNVMVNSYAKIVLNHNSNLIMTHEGSPTSILMPASDYIGLHPPHYHYQQNQAVASKYHHLY